MVKIVKVVKIIFHSHKEIINCQTSSSEPVFTASGMNDILIIPPTSTEEEVRTESTEGAKSF